MCYLNRLFFFIPKTILCLVHWTLLLSGQPCTLLYVRVGRASRTRATRVEKLFGENAQREHIPLRIKFRLSLSLSLAPASSLSPSHSRLLYIFLVVASYGEPLSLSACVFLRVCVCVCNSLSCKAAYTFYLCCTIRERKVKSSAPIDLRAPLREIKTCGQKDSQLQRVVVSSFSIVVWNWRNFFLFFFYQSHQARVCEDPRGVWLQWCLRNAHNVCYSSFSAHAKIFPSERVWLPGCSALWGCKPVKRKM